MVEDASGTKAAAAAGLHPASFRPSEIVAMAGMEPETFGQDEMGEFIGVRGRRNRIRNRTLTLHLGCRF